MVKIKWIITDSIETIDLNKFNTEWNGIYGYFEMIINDKLLGFCPNRELLDVEEGNEDILYWLSELSDGLINLNKGKSYGIQLLSMNLAKIVLKKNDKLTVSLVKSDGNEIIWSEKITIQEWHDEVIVNLEKFLKKIKEINADLLDNKLVKSLIKIKDLLNCNGG